VVVVDCVTDVETIVDSLGIDLFAVTGGSGGGPHALAVAARLDGRVTRAECVVGVAPFQAFGSEWSTGMDPENVTEFGRAQQGEDVLHRELSRAAQEDLARMSEDPTKIFSEVWNFEAADRHLLGRADIQHMLYETMHEAFRNGVWGWVDDDLAFLVPGASSSTRSVRPSRFRYGEQDVMVPAAHGEWLAAHVPGAKVVVEEESGHLPDPERRLEELLALAESVD
jgi:pimeloyl-ACP methyl ester carboxylesterase